MYSAFAQSAFQTQLAYRGQVWASLFGSLVHIFAWIAVWISVYGDARTVDGVTLSQMVTYALVGGVLATWQWRRLLNLVGNSVTSGDVAIYLLKPLHYPLYLFATECGNLAYRLVVVGAPVVLVVGLAYGMMPPASLFHGLMFIPFWALSFVIMFLLAALCGLIAFWLLTAFSLEWLLQGILSLLSGTAIPLWLFPGPVAAVVTFLPFAWVGYHPIAVYLGKTSVMESWFYLGVGLAWAAVLTVAVALLWRKAALRIVVQGG